LLGYVAGEMLVSEASLQPLVEAQHALHWLVPLAGAVVVLGMGYWLAVRKAQAAGAVDLVDETVSDGRRDASQKVSDSEK
jgi:hypothetical protein